MIAQAACHGTESSHWTWASALSIATVASPGSPMHSRIFDIMQVAHNMSHIDTAVCGVWKCKHLKAIKSESVKVWKFNQTTFISSLCLSTLTGRPPAEGAETWAAEVHLLWSTPGESLVFATYKSGVWRFTLSSLQVSVVSVCLVVASLALGCVTFLIYRYPDTIPEIQDLVYVTMPKLFRYALCLCRYCNNPHKRGVICCWNLF